MPVDAVTLHCHLVFHNLTAPEMEREVDRAAGRFSEESRLNRDRVLRIIGGECIVELFVRRPVSADRRCCRLCTRLPSWQADRR